MPGRSNRFKYTEQSAQRSLARLISSRPVDKVRCRLQDQQCSEIRANIDSSFNVPQATCDGKSPLTLAAESNRLRICKMLHEEFNANPFAPDDLGKSAVERARDRGCTDVLQYLTGEEPQQEPELQLEERISSASPPRSDYPASPMSVQSTSTHSLSSMEDEKEVEVVSESSTRSLGSLRRERLRKSRNTPSRREKKFILFDKRKKIQRIYERLLDLQPVTTSHFVTEEMEAEYNPYAIQQELDELRTIFEKEKKLLIENPLYFQSMKDIRNTWQYLASEATDQQYGAAWFNSMLEDEAWNRNVDDLQDEWAAARSYRKSQFITDFTQIYPFAVVTQNRVNEVLRDLAELTDALDGLYMPEGGVKAKRIARAFEKSAFQVWENRRYKADIWDFSRGLITYNSLEEILMALSEFDAFEDIEIINVDCNFKKHDPNVPLSEQRRNWRSSWQDVKVHFWFIRQCPRIICELQLCLTHFTNARRNLSKKSGHAAYARFRGINEIERYVNKMLEDNGNRVA